MPVFIAQAFRVEREKVPSEGWLQKYSRHRWSSGPNKQARRNGFHEFARQKADLSFEALIPKAAAVLAPPGPVIRVMPNMKLINVRTV